jgi:transposase
MPKPYSYDLRKRVIKCFKKKMRYQNIADNLDLSLSTIERYSALYKASNDIKVKNLCKTGRKAKIEDLYKLKKFVKENNHLSIVDMAHKLKVSKSALHRSIIKAKFSFKKSHGYIVSAKKKREKNL